MVDLDRFKQINDSYGHLEGDKLIIHMANIIKAEIRENDFAFDMAEKNFLLFLMAVLKRQKVAERIELSMPIPIMKSTAWSWKKPPVLA